MYDTKATVGMPDIKAIAKCSNGAVTLPSSSERATPDGGVLTAREKSTVLEPWRIRLAIVADAADVPSLIRSLDRYTTLEFPSLLPPYTRV
jgi:hypothetical protein